MQHFLGRQLSLLFRDSLLIWGAFIVCAALGMIINPQAFLKFFYLGLEVPELNPSLSYFWDQLIPNFQPFILSGISTHNN